MTFVLSIIFVCYQYYMLYQYFLVLLLFYFALWGDSVRMKYFLPGGRFSANEVFLAWMACSVNIVKTSCDREFPRTSRNCEFLKTPCIIFHLITMRKVLSGCAFSLR